MSRNESNSWCYDQPLRRESYTGESDYKESRRKASYNRQPESTGCCYEPQWERCSPKEYCYWYYGSPWSQWPSHEQGINATTTVNICQQGEANGGNANGGNGGNANGGSAAAASAETEGEGDASASASICENGPDSVQTLRKAMANPNLNEQDLQALQALLDLQIGAPVAIGDAAAAGGTATGGNGGDGGTGGAGGSVSQTATVVVENYVLVCCGVENGDASPPTVRLGVNGKNVEITMDEKGNTLVNGQKMDEQQLDNGTRVFIFRNSETKKSE